MRFDGKMSAKRRKETLERFSIPLAETGAAPSASQAPSPHATTRSVRSRRTNSRSASMVIDEPVEGGPNDGDSDFVASGGEEDGHDSFQDDSDEDKPAKKGKGRTHAKGKGKAKATSTPNISEYETGELDGITNPKVGFISLVIRRAG